MTSAAETGLDELDGTVRIAEAVLKPFQEPWCGSDLIALGALTHILPPPPARLLDLDCGYGWVSCVLTWMGYTVVGLDGAPDLISQARSNGWRARAASATFRVGDYEDLSFRDEFDGAVFYGSLRYARDEGRALSGVHRALRTGGVCVCREPVQWGAPPDAVERTMRACGFRDRPRSPEAICAIARAAGFRTAVAYPLPEALLDVHWGLQWPARADPKTGWARWYDRLTWAAARRRRRRRREVLDVSARFGHMVVLTK